MMQDNEHISYFTTAIKADELKSTNKNLYRHIGIRICKFVKKNQNFTYNQMIFQYLHEKVLII